MASAPQGLTLKRHRDLVGREHKPYARWILLSVLIVGLVLALLNFFGQRPSTASAEGSAAGLSVYAPTTVRGGLYYEARFTVTARSELKDAFLVLDQGWMEGMTINTIEPSPVSEGSRDGKLALELGRVPAGHSYVLYMQLQVNPTNVGRSRTGVALFDGRRQLLRIDRKVTIFP